MKDTLVFTATFNEKDNVDRLVREIFNSSNEVDVLVIDDNSPDGTGKILEEIKKRESNFSFITREKN